MPREQVAAAAVAVMIEAHFRSRDPAGSPESQSCGILHKGVRPINQPIQIGSAPSNFHHQRPVECGGQPCQGAERQSIERAPFSPRNRVAG